MSMKLRGICSPVLFAGLAVGLAIMPLFGVLDGALASESEDSMIQISMPPLVYTSLVSQCQTSQVSPFLVMGVIKFESAWKWGAMGDYDVDTKDRFPNDPFWQPRDDGLFPHSFGLMQIHVDHAGKGYTPSQLLDIQTNLYVGIRYLRSCIAAFGNDWRKGVSAYNQGVNGVMLRGADYNKAYVDNVLGSTYAYYEAAIAITEDVGGQWRIYERRN